MDIKPSLLSVFLLILSILSGFGAVLGQDTKPGPQTIKGQLVMIAGEVAIIKDRNGKTVHVPTSKATKVEGRVKDGDMVEASLSADGQATLIKPSQ